MLSIPSIDFNLTIIGRLCVSFYSRYFSEEKELVISSAMPKIEGLPLTFQFFASSEEGIQLFVDLDWCTSDWIKNLKDEVSIYPGNIQSQPPQELRENNKKQKRNSTSKPNLYLNTIESRKNANRKCSSDLHLEKTQSLKTSGLKISNPITNNSTISSSKVQNHINESDFRPKHMEKIHPYPVSGSLYFDQNNSLEPCSSLGMPTMDRNKVCPMSVSDEKQLNYQVMDASIFHPYICQSNQELRPENRFECSLHGRGENSSMRSFPSAPRSKKRLPLLDIGSNR